MYVRDLLATVELENMDKILQVLINLDINKQNRDKIEKQNNNSYLPVRNSSTYYRSNNIRQYNNSSYPNQQQRHSNRVGQISNDVYIDTSIPPPPIPFRNYNNEMPSSSASSLN